MPDQPSPHGSVFDAEMASELADLESQDLRREELVLRRSGPVAETIAGEHLLNFSSNDYLGLAAGPAGRFRDLPTGAGASRLVTGTHEIHRDVERTYADFFGLEDSLLFSSGFAANVGVISALVGPEDVVFSDSLNHASIIDGVRLSGARRLIYPHRNFDSLRSLLAEHRRSHRRALVVSEAIFSMDGTVAELDLLRALCDRFGAAMMIDEAHSAGVVGPSGRGLCAAMNVRPDILVATFGKAFGTGGAVVASSKVVRTWLFQNARSLVFSTAPTPGHCHQLLRRLEQVAAADTERKQVLEYAAGLRDRLGLPSRQSAIVPVVVGSAGQALTLQNRLRDAGILARAIRPPTVPDGQSRVRLVPTAAHTSEHLAALHSALDEHFT